jgi:hypothetical protein
MQMGMSVTGRKSATGELLRYSWIDGSESGNCMAVWKKVRTFLTALCRELSLESVLMEERKEHET